MVRFTSGTPARRSSYAMRADTDAFDFVSPAGATWTCEVTARFPKHLDDGFVEITGSDGAPLDVVFRSAHGPGRDHAFPPMT